MFNGLIANRIPVRQAIAKASFPRQRVPLSRVKNSIKLPVNRSSDKAIAKQELKENAVRNIYLSLAFILFIVDQISKILIKSKFSVYEHGWKTSDNLNEIPIIDPFLIFKRIDNPGIAFGFDSNGDFSYIITPLTIILTILIAVYLYKVSNKINTLLSLDHKAA